MLIIKGSGKTLAYVVPVLNEMFNRADREANEDQEQREEEEQLEDVEDEDHEARAKRISAVILFPTRELAVQVLSVIKELLSHCRDTPKYNFRVCLISGGFAAEKQERELKKGPNILLATIGRLSDFISKREFDILETLPQSDFLVIDEVDRILELGQFKQVESILKFIENP